MEDLYKVTGDLMKFERFKNRLPQEARDINKLTPETLYDQVKDFSLEKTKATADEKKEASKTYQHPGAEIVYRGATDDWFYALGKTRTITRHLYLKNALMAQLNNQPVLIFKTDPIGCIFN